MSDVVVWHAGGNILLVSEPDTHGAFNPGHLMETRRIEHNDSNGNPWHPGYRMNGTPSNRPTTHLPACAFSIPMSAQHTQVLTQGLQRCQHANHKVHFGILNNDYCLTPHLLAGEIMAIPHNESQQTSSQQQQQQQQHNLTSVMHTHQLCN